MNTSSPAIPNVQVAAGPYEKDDPLSDALDTRLLAHPRVRDFHKNTREDSILQLSDAPPGSVVRTVRLTDRILSIVAIPDGFELLPGFRRRLCNHWRHANLLVVSERWLRRRPHLEGSALIADCSRYPVPPMARVLLAQHLTENGGSSYLGDCAAYAPGTQDPIRAVLSLAAAKALSIDISRPIGPLTRVSLPPIG